MRSAWHTNLFQNNCYVFLLHGKWTVRFRSLSNLSNSPKLLSAMCGFALWRRNQQVQHILVLRFAGSAHGPHRHRYRRLLHKAEEGEKAIGQGLQSQLLKGTTLVGKKSRKEKQNHVGIFV